MLFPVSFAQTYICVWNNVFACFFLCVYISPSVFMDTLLYMTV